MIEPINKDDECPFIMTNETVVTHKSIGECVYCGYDRYFNDLSGKISCFSCSYHNGN